MGIKIKKMLLMLTILSSALSGVTPVYADGVKVTAQAEVELEDAGEEKEIPESSTITDFEGSDEEAFKQSLVASQFTIPFGNNLYDVLSDPVLKETLKDLYTENGVQKELTYSKLLKKDKSGKYVDARVLDIFSTESNGDPIEFFVEYEYEEYNEETEEFDSSTDYEKVYYSNPYSYFYVSLYLSHMPALAESFTTVATNTVDIDNYGNIVVNDKLANKRHRIVVIPNIINPMLNVDDLFYLPTMKFLYMYETNMKSMSTNSNLTSSQMKTLYGKKLGSNKFSMYDINSSDSLDLMDFINRVSKLKLSQFISVPASTSRNGNSMWLSPEFLKYINANRDGSDDSEDFVMFAYGNSFEPGYFNRFQDDLLYGDLSEIMTAGVGKKNSSMSILPKGRLYLGNSSSNLKIESGSVSIVDTSGTAKGGYSFYYHDFEEALKESLFSNTAGYVGHITTKEVALAVSLVSEFYSTMDLDKVINFSYNSTSKDSENGKPGESIITKPEDAYDQKVNNIVNNIDYFFTNIGSAFSSMTSSKMSKQYYNLNTAFNENLMFNMTEVLDDPFVQRLLSEYMNLVMVISLAIYLISLMQYTGSTKDKLVSYFKTSIFGVGMCLLPILVFGLYIKACNYSTEGFLQDSYVTWFISDINTDNSVSSNELAIDKYLYGYFKESNSLPKKNKGIVEFYDAAPDESGSYSKQLSLNELNRVGLVRGNGSEEDTVFANKDSYYKSIFFYFYDTFRWHMYNYYGGQVPGWDNADGLISSKGNFVNMVTDPGFLYGSSYLEQESKLLSGELPRIDYTKISTQDILGLTHLFNKDSVGGRESYQDDVIGSYWYQVLNQKLDSSKARGEKLRNDLDSYAYPDGVIYGSALFAKDNAVTGFSNFELSLQSINNTIAVELQKLVDYEKCLDETVLYAASLIATFEFNKEMNKYLDSAFRLHPTTFESSTYSMDTVYRSVFMRTLDEESLYDGDLMLAIESQGGMIVQGLTLACTFIGQIVGLEKLIGSIILFLLAIIVFVFAYNIHRNLFNKAWLGLLGLFLSLATVHALFLLGVNIICVPEYSVIRASLFGSFLPGLKIFLLLILLLIKGAAILFIVYFAFKYYRDLGGTIIASRLHELSASVTGLLHIDGDGSNVNSTNSDINSDNTNLNSNEADVELDGPVQFTQWGESSSELGIDSAEASIANMDTSTDMIISDDADVDVSSVSTLNESGTSQTITNAFDFSLDKSENSVDNSVSNDSNFNVDSRSLVDSKALVGIDNGVDINSGTVHHSVGGTSVSSSTYDGSSHTEERSVTKHDVKDVDNKSSVSSNVVYNNGTAVERAGNSDVISQVSQADSTSTVESKSQGSGSTYSALNELTDFMNDSSQSMKRNDVFSQLYKERNKGE